VLVTADRVSSITAEHDAWIVAQRGTLVRAPAGQPRSRHR
jgi:hypothetical protein